MSDHVLCLRTCEADLKSYNGFTWPKKGQVKCEDWKPVAACGNGLHGLLWGVGHAGYLNNDKDSKWLVVKVRADEIVDIQDKVKFPRGEVVFCGSRDRAVAYIQRQAPKGSNVVFGKFPGRFKKVAVDGVKAVRDAYTGLTWEAAGSTKYMNFAAAQEYCKQLGPGWRMPTLAELRTIVDYRGKTYTIDERFFTCHGWWYWSSTPTPVSGFAWGVNFGDGGSGGLLLGDDNDVDDNDVRAVRASQ